MASKIDFVIVFITFYFGLSQQKLQPEILDLGNVILEQLVNKTEEDADLIYNNFAKYHNLLQKLNDSIWSKNGEVVSKGMGIFDALEEDGGPPQLVHDLHYKIFKDKFNWREEDFNKIKNLVNDTKVLWEVVKDRANRLRIGTWGVDSKVEDETETTGDDDSDGELH